MELAMAAFHATTFYSSTSRWSPAASFRARAMDLHSCSSQWWLRRDDSRLLLCPWRGAHGNGYDDLVRR
ncbi:hypothetical protein DEO72_LG9g1862 [Vigna unguiculata]|uniref:Uncharacterized protein n=1 Tax=Vigna unguiculata TaxID=3917 RepID=A0A4D6N0P5_VIGUN|nr:hypothetical protein DEO72_LG9g1862 [Vigna unguiculata]